jgi:maleylacetoacetate isomerase/maleylpyruvate isomerase
MKLLGYWRSGATYRVRIVLALKGLDYDYEPVNLLKGEQRSAPYLAGNPQGLVPTLVTEDGDRLAQSLAICEYLEEKFPEPSVLPKDAIGRARARAIAAAIACEAQPFQNQRVQKYLRDEAAFDDGKIAAWLDRWVGGALAAVETMVAETGGKFCVGDQPSLADAFLVPQLYAAERFKVDVSKFARLNAVHARCATHPAFIKAHPDNQPDAIKS